MQALLDPKVSDADAIRLRGERFAREEALRDKESASVVMRIMGATCDTLFCFDGEARLAFRALIAYVLSHDDKKGRNSDANCWNTATSIQFYVTMVDGLRSLWENLKEKPHITEGRDIRATANAIDTAAVSMDTRQGSESLGEKLKTINIRVLDSTRIETFKKEFPTSLERLLSETRTLKRGYDGQQSQNAAQKTPRHSSYNHVCLFSLSETSGFGDCNRIKLFIRPTAIYRAWQFSLVA
jgi:hypothetical protein